MSREYPYATERTPIVIIEARYRLVRQLERVYGQAVNERIRYCKEHGIEYLHDVCKPCPDKTLAKLRGLYLTAHTEAVMLPIKISDIERRLRRR